MGYIFGTSSYTGGTAITQYYSSVSYYHETYYIPTNLKTVTVTGGEVLYGAFYGCSELTSVTIGNSVTSIDDYAFYNCSGLTSITIPNSVTSIRSSAFEGCSGLATITLPFIGKTLGYIFGTSSYIGGTATRQYYSSSTYGYETYYIPTNLKTVTVTGGDLLYGAFYNCSGLTSVTIGNSVTSIGERAFYNCSELTSVTIGDVVTSIGSYAFSGCSRLTSITIPDSVTSIGEGAFRDCRGLAAVNISDISSWCDISFIGYLSNPLNYANVLYINGEVATSITIPDSVTSIGDYAFYNCSVLTSVMISDSVTTIGYAAFGNCSGLTSITLPFVGNSETATSASPSTLFGSIFGTSYYTGGTATKQYYSSSSSTTYCIPTNLKTVTVTGGDMHYGAFYGCNGLTSVTIESGVTYIGSSAFSGYTAAIIWGDNPTITTIEERAFDNYKGSSITIPGSVTSIGSYAFYKCSELTSITIPDSVTSIGSFAFEGCSALAAVSISDIGSWCEISFKNYLSNPLYYANVLYINGKVATSITIPDSVTSIGSYAFYKCSGLTSVTIPDSVTSIGGSAFSDCSGLTSITIPNSVTSIGGSAFSGCSGLTSITIPNSVTSIGNYAFAGCNGLTSITISNSVTSIGIEAFYNCSGLTSITIPDSVTSIGSCAFWGCSALTSITIPNSVTAIGRSAFLACSRLTSITLPFIGKTLNDTSSAYLGYIFEGYAQLPLSLKIVVFTGSFISNGAFIGGSGLTSITISNSVTSIGDGAFSGCSGLTSITIPNSVTSIGSYAFRNCSGLTSITLPFVGNSNTATSASPSTLFGSIFGTSYYTGGTATKQYYSSSSSTTYYIPTSLKTVTITGGDIFYGAFYNCSGLTSVIIGGGVTSICERAFYGCSELTSITLANAAGWHRTTSQSNWQAKIGGTLTNVANVSTNATYFTSTYANYYWYKL